MLSDEEILLADDVGAEEGVVEKLVGGRRRMCLREYEGEHCESKRVDSFREAGGIDVDSAVTTRWKEEGAKKATQQTSAHVTNLIHSSERLIPKFHGSLKCGCCARAVMGTRKGTHRAYFRM